MLEKALPAVGTSYAVAERLWSGHAVSMTPADLALAEPLCPYCASRFSCAAGSEEAQLLCVAAAV